MSLAPAAPPPVLSREREAALTDRQRELLDQLTEVFDDGFANLTMADLARRLNCSLRTLYGLAPSKDELVLMVVDRNLRRVGRSARSAVGPDMAPLDAIRAYLSAATVAVSSSSDAFARDFAAVPAAEALARQHSDYLVAVTRALLDDAVERGDIVPVDTAAVAHVMAGVGHTFSQPDIRSQIGSNPKAAADAIVDLLLRGLLDL